MNFSISASVTLIAFGFLVTAMVIIMAIIDYATRQRVTWLANTATAIGTTLVVMNNDDWHWTVTAVNMAFVLILGFIFQVAERRFWTERRVK